MNASFDPLLAERLPDDLASALDAARGRLGRMGLATYFLTSTPSTNDVAQQLANAGAGDGTTIVADVQTAGRGRLGRTWHSPPGAGLYVSVVMRPGAVEQRLRLLHGEARAALPLPARLTLLAGVALAEAIRTVTALPVEIKWPNDIVFAGRKLAGILAEASAQNGAIEFVVLGIGINVLAIPFPAEIAGRASSLEAELGRPVDRGRLLAEVLVNLGQGFDALKRDAIVPWFDRWRALSPSSVGTLVEWRAPDGVRRGRTAGLDTDGALLVGANRGLERVVAGEVIWL